MFHEYIYIYINQSSGNATTHASIIRIYTIDATNTSFKIVITDFGSATAMRLVGWLLMRFQWEWINF